MSARAARPAPPLELNITRVFAAPRELVFEAWTHPAHMMSWWGPRDHPIKHARMDVRPGGVWRHCLDINQTGGDMWQGGVFREVDPPRRLVFTFAWEVEGERGLETLVTVAFEDAGEGRTRMTFHQAPFQSENERDGHRGGWTSSFDRLDDHFTRTPQETP